METQATQRQRVAEPYGFIHRLEKYINKLSFWLNCIAGAGLIGMLLLVVADIIGIKLFRSPIPGAIETVAFLGVVVIGFAVAYTQVLHGHIRVDFIVMKFPPKFAAIIDVLMLIMGMSLFVILTWYSFEYAQVIRASGEVSMTQRIPFYPFVYGMAFCFGVTFLVLLVEFIKSLIRIGTVWNR
ncbi:MAG TPA: TRAP transporter small permease [Dehalococcoidales bacterium]|nr:TRAP transporter small permease [Dehalococcoidales bacterium]